MAETNTLHQALVLIEQHLHKRASFRELRKFSEAVKIQFWVIVSGRPAGETHHRDVYVAFSEEDAQDCYEHILDDWQECALENWLWGPHISFMCGNPAKTTNWNGFHEEPVPIWKG